MQGERCGNGPADERQQADPWAGMSLALIAMVGMVWAGISLLGVAVITGVWLFSLWVDKLRPAPRPRRANPLNAPIWTPLPATPWKRRSRRSACR
jgi:hypothetical protein